MSNATLEYSQMTKDQLNPLFVAAVEELEVLDAKRAESGATGEMNDQRAELKVRIADLKAAIVKAGAEIEEIDTSLPEPVESAKVDDDSDDDEEDDEEDGNEPKLSDEELEAAAKRAAANLGDADGGKPMKARRKVRKATINKASGESATKTYSGELATAEARAKHIAARKGGTGAVLGVQRFDVADMEADEYLRAGAGEPEHRVAIDAAHARRAAAEGDDREVAKAGLNRAGAVHKAGCGCSSCGTPINELPEIFCNLGDEVSNWFTEVPMEDGCMVTIQQAVGKAPDLITNSWNYGCIATGEVDANGNPTYTEATGLIVLDKDGNITVPKPWDPTDESTWKVPNLLATQKCIDVKYSLQAESIAYDVSRSARLCKAQYVDRELRRGARALRKIEAVRGLTALCVSATRGNLTYTGDGSAGLNFGVGLASLIADEFDALSDEHCLDLSGYTAFVINAPQKWLDMETMRSGGRVSAAGVLQECFGEVIRTNCLPAGVERPYTALGGTEGAPHELSPTACEREVTVILADKARWIKGGGNSYSLVEDRGSRCTALGNGEFHFMEDEYTHIPTDEFPSMKMTFLLNNKGQIVEDAPPSCPAPAGKKAAAKAEG